MPVRIDHPACYFKVSEDGQEQRLTAAQVTVNTDSVKAMSFVEVNAERIYITEAEADALTVAGAQDGRKHLKATDDNSLV
ncbi:hypothetical protein AO391_03350 [Pseudomonas marginalis ICMP 9505]|nr:hypothetical protein AO391_03350 [Pseudomonas marginalis ICMP 9505]